MRTDDLNVGLILKHKHDDGWRGVVIFVRTQESPEARFAVVQIFDTEGFPTIHHINLIPASLISRLDSFEVAESV